MKQFYGCLIGLGIWITPVAQNVGIGTTNPAFKLDVSTGSINTDSLYRINAFSVLSVKGTGNLFTGKSAGFNNTTGYSNTFCGDSAGLFNTTAEYNTFVGYNAGLNNISGTRNTALGSRSFLNNTSGEFNTAIGSEALLYNSTGIHNTAIGSSSMSFNTGGSYNVAVGDFSLSGNTSGFNNTAMGIYALTANSTGSTNAGFGYGALYENTTGNYNVAMGFGTLAANTAGNYNSALGYNANVSTVNLINATAIGAQSLVSQSNSLVLGSIQGVNGAAASTNVGIGTSTPGASLHVNSSASLTTRFAGNTGMYLSLEENGNYRGYLGSFAGNAEDVDFGTGLGNTTGRVHLTLQAAPMLTIESSGNVNVQNEINRSSRTGTANLIPICYGNISSSGAINSGSGNFTVSQITTGLYAITITGETYQFQTYTTVVTPIGSPVITSTGSGAGSLQVYTYNAAGTATDSQFSFVVYKQ